MAKIITVYSVVQGNGAKFIATNLANSYKKANLDSKVALVDFDFRYPFLALSLAPQDNVHGIDNLIEKIDGKFLDKLLFEENMVHLKNGIHLLKGTQLQSNNYLIDRTHIEKVIEFLNELYDYVIIVANGDFDNSASIYSALHSDDIILVGQPNYPTYLNLENVSRKVAHYSKTTCNRWFVYNKFFDSKHVDLKSLITENNLTVLGIVPTIMESVDNMDLKETYIKSFLNSKPNKNEVNPFEEMIKKLEN